MIHIDKSLKRFLCGLIPVFIALSGLPDVTSAVCAAGEEDISGVGISDETVSAEENETFGDVGGSSVSYEVQGGNIYFDTGTGTVTNSDRNITEAIIPEKINDVTVTAIGSNAFQYRDDLERVSLPGTVTKIGDYAFRFDECLSDFTLGGSRFDPFDENNGVDVGYLAFTDCLFVRPDFSDSYKKGNYYRLLHSSATRDYLKGKEHYLSDITVIAKSQLGYHEGNSLNDMDGTSYGYGDYSEYTYFWGEPGMMWCGEFVAWCIAMASVPREIFTSKYHTPDECTFTWDQTSYAGSGGNYRLKQGDVLHFDYEGGNHVCLVYGSSYSAEDGIVTIDTLDGNHNNDVSREKYRIEAATGSVLNSWPDRNPVIKYIFSPDTSVVSDLTYYRVDFDVNGGDPLVKDGEEPNWTMDPRYKELTYRAFYGLMPLPTRAGYEFAGWYTGQNEGDEGDRKITSYMLFREHSDQTLYARWVKPDKGGEPEAGKGTGTYSDEREVSEAGYEGWKLDHATGTVTKIPDTWEGGEIPETLDGVAIRKIGKSASSGNDRVTEIVFPEGLEAIDSYAFSRCSALQKVTFPSTLLMIGEQCFYYCTDLEIVNCAGDMDLIRKGRYAFNRTPWLHGDMSPEFKRGPWYRDLQSVPSLSDPDYDPLQNVIDIGTALAGYHEGDDRSELTGINANGNGEYAEPVFFAGSPDYLWLKNVPYVSYGGWCGQYCSYILRMAGLPPAASGMINNNDEDEMTWEDLTVAGGSHELTRGDVLHMRIGHYCIVTNVEEKGDRVYVTTLNGNHGNGVCFDTYKLYKTNGYQKSGGTKSNYDVTDIYRYNPDWKTFPGIKSYKLLFDVNGGNELPSKYKTVYEGAYYGLLPDPHRDGYVFEGWFTAPGDGNGKKITPYRLVAGSENDVTVYAHWRQNSTSVTGVTVTKDNETVEIGKSKYLEAEVMPVTAVNRKLVWKSTDTAVATVDNNGKVEGVDTGETYIIAISEDGGFMGKCLVTVTDGSVRFDLTDGGYLMFNEETGTITGSGVIGESLVIPSVINGVSVTAIGKGAFSGQDSLKHVTIPDTVRMIGSEAFEGTSLEDLSLPDSVKQISSYAFYGIQSLETVYIPNSVRYIYYAAFLNCASLQKVTFQGSRENLKYLADNAFPEDPEGTLIVWGTEDYEGEDDWNGYSSGGSDKHEIGTKEKDYEIDDRGYIKGVFNITNAQIPSEIGGKTVKGISEWGFGNRVYLKSIAFPPTVKEIEDYAFFNCPCLETVFIPDSVEVIGKNCFGFNKNSLTSASSATAGSLSKVTIGSGVKTIKGYVFQNQTALEEIEIHAKKSEVTIDRDAFPAGVKVIFTEDQEPVTKDIDVDPADRKVTMIPGEIKKLELNKTGKFVCGVSWSVSFNDPRCKCVSVKDGVVTAKALKKGVEKGAATVTAKCNGISVPFEVTVDGTVYKNEPIEGEKGKKYKITAPKTLMLNAGTKKTVSVGIPAQLRDDGFVIKCDVSKPGIIGELSAPDRSNPSKAVYDIEPLKAGAAYIVWSMEDANGTTTAATKVIVKAPAGDFAIGTEESELSPLTVGTGKRLILTGQTGCTDAMKPSFSVKGKGVKVSRSGYVVAETPGANAEVFVKCGKVKKSIKVSVSGEYENSYILINKNTISVKAPKPGAAKPKTAVLKLSMPKKDRPDAEWMVMGTDASGKTVTPDGISLEPSTGQSTVISVGESASPGCYIVTAAAGGYNTAYCELVVN